MLETLKELLAELSVAEEITLSSHNEKLVGIPDCVANGRTGAWLTSDNRLNGKLWTHQAKAIEQINAGNNVVVNTGTASGKSLIYQSSAIMNLDQNPDCRIAVFYPLKALVSDQLKSWKEVMTKAGLPSNIVAKIDGDIPPDEREEALKTARVVLFTPDVLHAWLMRNVSLEVCRDFLANLNLIVIDEVHALESVFGSNFALLFRRLHAARNTCAKENSNLTQIQIVATGATIANPKDHLRKLTGQDFILIGRDDDGAPRYERQVIHLICDSDNAVNLAAELQRGLIDGSDNGTFITFVDSRKGVENLAIKTDYPDLVASYRAGYEVSDRQRIEQNLKNGKLKGVLSTSALELGIDIAHFVVGLNIGVPGTRKSFLQRLGRIGRNRPGVFVVIADRTAFSEFGSSLSDYYESAVEPSHLYLFNRFIQYSHARCLAEELEMLGKGGKSVQLPKGIEWPEGFENVFEFSYSGAPRIRPREFDAIAQIGGDAPHTKYQMRNVVEESFKLKIGNSPNSQLGTINLSQAIREAYPGGVYLHKGKGYWVNAWKSSALDRSIIVARAKKGAYSKPIIRKWVNFSVDRDSIVEGHFKGNKSNFIAECQLRITVKVEGYTQGSKKHLYKDLQQKKPNMRAKSREFETTGVVLRFESDKSIFSAVKRAIANSLLSLVRREFSIAPQDIDAAASNISMIRGGLRKPISDAIVIYDATHGSLRLTELVYSSLDKLHDQLTNVSNDRESTDSVLDKEAVGLLSDWYNALGSEIPDDFLELGLTETETPEGWLQIICPGSLVAHRDQQNVLNDIEIIKPKIMSVGGPSKLYYQYKFIGRKVHERFASTGMAFVEESNIETIGDEWNYKLWNPETDEIIELPSEEDDYF
jgi:DEAD/DEAH box helicase domain-containing protein